MPIVNFGKMALTGFFPKSKKEIVPHWPLELVKCSGLKGCCGLVQLAHRYPEDVLFGNSYGYRSGLNPVISQHLKTIVQDVVVKKILRVGDVVCDVGSNDGTLLNAYKQKGLLRIGIDPTANKFSKFYNEGIVRINNFFNGEKIRRVLKGRKIKVLTTISIFYDLNDPLSFMNEVVSLLSADGLWILEQSYLPSMLKNNAFDSICHEHAAYYGLKQLQWMANVVGLKVIKVKLTELNGGSLKVIFAHKDSDYKVDQRGVNRLLAQEATMKLDGELVYKEFAENIEQIKHRVKAFFVSVKKQGKMVVGYGASTKGNVLLQLCKLTSKDLTCILDVNPDKWGCYTPGSLIPIVNEQGYDKTKADYLFVLPWHFQEYFAIKEKNFFNYQRAMVFPLPNFEIIKKFLKSKWRP
jgi:hypothetical protein